MKTILFLQYFLSVWYSDLHYKQCAITHVLWPSWIILHVCGILSFLSLYTQANICTKAHTHASSCSNSFFSATHTHTHSQQETPARNEKSIGVAWKERGLADGEKSSRSDFHPETVHWCPTALWSPGGNNIQLTFHWRNVIPLSLRQRYLIAGLAATHMHFSMRTTHTYTRAYTLLEKTQPWLILIQVTPTDHQCSPLLICSLGLGVGFVKYEHTMGNHSQYCNAW